MELHGKHVGNGEYAGKCPFKDIGRDRFRWWPGKDLWWCRNPDNCIDCPGLDSKDIGTKYGSLSYNHANISNLSVPDPKAIRKDLPTLERAMFFHSHLDERAVQFLRDRGICYETALRFLVGVDGNWLTIPSIIGRRCIAIKKRWIGTGPSPIGDNYKFELGSIGKSLFNWDRFTSRKRWSVALINKTPLDTMLLDQLGIITTGPLAGENVWDEKWTPMVSRADVLLNVGDNDSEGVVYAERRQLKLNGNSRLVYPPAGKDLTESYLYGIDLHDWIRSETKR
jgi:hypothetical protein